MGPIYKVSSSLAMEPFATATVLSVHPNTVSRDWGLPLAQPAEKRAEFIEQACPGDPQLGAEVESLLKDAGEGPL
jgi:DNA-binding transcriptional regulator YdaS (Cro superfamily)